jgi:phage regulator Rha-like protein
MQYAVAVNFKESVRFTGEKLVTDSLVVAKAFGKYHYHVIAKLKKLDCSAQFLTNNFT